MAIIDDNALNIYADGSSLSHPRSGGAGFRFITVGEDGNEQFEDFFGTSYIGATNNQMELQACINALKEALSREDWNHVSKVIIFSDSRYVVDNYYHAIFTWPKTGWTKKTGEPVLNVSQWKELVKCTGKIYEKFKMRTELRWVKGHATDEHNKAVDKTAKAAAKIKSSRKVHTTVVRRKKFDTKVQKGCVTMRGQRLSIRVVTAEYLQTQKISRYRYQVLSKKSPYYRCTDFIYSKEHLSAGHEYFVRVNSDSDYPQITRVFKEIEN